MNRIRIKKAFLLILILFPLASLFSHPHMLLYSRCELEFEEEILKGVWIELEFDRFFSGEIIWGYDGDRNGVFDETETTHLYEGAFASLRDYNYFVFIQEGKEHFSPDEVFAFSAWVEGGDILFYKYFVPLDEIKRRSFSLAVYDSTFFCSCRYQEDYFSVSGTEESSVSVHLVDNEDKPVYYNPQGKMNDLTLYDTWAPGLNTFIPTEIHIEY